MALNRSNPRQRRRYPLAAAAAGLAFCCVAAGSGTGSGCSFLAPPAPRGGASRALPSSPVPSLPGSDSGGEVLDREADDLFLERFRRRRRVSRFRRSARRQLLPPDAAISGPEDFVRAVLGGMRVPSSPLSGICGRGDKDMEEGTEAGEDGAAAVLFRCSTGRWRESIRRFVGVGVPPADAGGDGAIVRALGAALGERDCQFNLLLGTEYVATFPTEAVQEEDGRGGETCWLECRLRDAGTDDLLAATGWTLRRKEGDGAWLLDHLDWQDFREGFRPGIGREEWERICG